MSGPFIASSGSLKKSRCTMEFGDVWGKGEIFDWCRKNFTSTVVTRLEIRISRDAVPHRFVVAYMQDGTIYRFDRRPRTPNLFIIASNPVPASPIDNEPTTRAADEVCIPGRAELLEMDLSTYWEINLVLPENVDIYLIISACYAIAQDKKARNYALREYNCYFFSWTIVMLVTRHLLPFTVPSPTAVQYRFDTRVPQGSIVISDIIVKALLDIVLDVVAAFDSLTGEKLNKGLSKRELAVWGLPLPIFRALLRQCLKIRIHCGLKKKLDERVRHQLETRAPQVLLGVLGNAGGATSETQDGAPEVDHRDVAGAVRDRLWLNELLTELRQPVHEEILQILWDSILDAIAEGYGDVKADMVQEGIKKLSMWQRVKYHLFGKNVIQFSQIWSEALRAALPAARAAGHGQYRPDKTHEEMFDIAFNAGADEALQAAKNVVRETGPAMANPKRDEMWEVVWGVWDDVWELSRTTTRAMVVNVVKNTLAEIVSWVTEDVVKELGDNSQQKLQATIRFKRNKTKHLQGQGAELSLEAFQLNIRKFISLVPGQTPEHSARIEDAMTRAWEVSSRTYKPLDNVTR
ncbi:hypothetical protein BDV93DRAFT_527833 [Ceratobasidium sp. AG-I]|nr:hypothetical protein BDV93DRAFT_527833 [Ceratobasidium sp. AG-I]